MMQTENEQLDIALGKPVRARIVRRGPGERNSKPRTNSKYEAQGNERSKELEMRDDYDMEVRVGETPLPGVQILSWLQGNLQDL